MPRWFPKSTVGLPSSVTWGELSLLHQKWSAPVYKNACNFYASKLKGQIKFESFAVLLRIPRFLSCFRSLMEIILKLFIGTKIQYVMKMKVYLCFRQQLVFSFSWLGPVIRSPSRRFSLHLGCFKCLPLIAYLMGLVRGVWPSVCAFEQAASLSNQCSFRRQPFVLVVYGLS